MVMCGSLRHDIQDRLEQLLAEADKLRHALAALDPRPRPAPAPTEPRAPQPAQPHTPAAQRAKARAQTAPDATTTAKPRARTAPGATKTAVLGALVDGRAMTASEVAAATGLARPTVSTTLSNLTKRGEVLKADRGYQRPKPDGVVAKDDASGVGLRR